MPSAARSSTQRDLIVHILYGTQTGNAEETAYRAADALQRQRFKVRVRTLEDYDGLALVEDAEGCDEEKSHGEQEGSRRDGSISPISAAATSQIVFVFILSTTGAGEFPRAAREFWTSLLRSDLPTDALQDVAYATLGLGDTSYPRFCWPARMLNARLKGLGATQVLDPVEADDQDYLGIDGALHPWLANLITTLSLYAPLPEGAHVIPDDTVLPARVAIRLCSSVHSQIPSWNGVKGKNSCDTDHPPQGYRSAKLTRNERLTARHHFQDVRQIEWLCDEDIKYQAGDVAAVVPENDPDEVRKLCKRLGWEDLLDREVDLVPRDADVTIPSHIPRRTTLLSLLVKYLSPFSTPRGSFFKLLHQIAPGPSGPDEGREQEKLAEFCTPGEGMNDCWDYAGRVRRTMVEVLEEFGHTAAELAKRVDLVADLFGWMTPREFSIASGPSMHPRSVQLAVAIVSYKTRLKERRKGVCTSWLSSLVLGSRIHFQVRSGTLPHPEASIPLILVGPGTGIAPMRSLIEERVHALRHHPPPSTPAPNPSILLFAGHRSRDADYLFSSEWAAYMADEHLARFPALRVETAFSRPEEVGAEKLYVQERMREADVAHLIWDMLGHGGASVYVSGSSGAMPKAVRAAVVEACSACGDMSEEQAGRFVTRLEGEGRWVEECWS